MRSPTVALFVVAFVVGVVASAAGCGGGQTRARPFEVAWSDEDGTELVEFQKGWKGETPRALPAVVVGVIDRNNLVGRTLAPGAETWLFRHPLEGRPRIAGDVVVGIGGGFLFALDARSGEPHWMRRVLGELRGADDDGEVTLVSIASLSGRRSTVLAIDRAGTVLRQLDEEALIGAPVVVDRFAFLPYDRRHVVIFDLVSGREEARVVTTHQPSGAFRIGRAIYFGGNGALLFDEQVVEARRGGGVRVMPPPRMFPLTPSWLRPGDVPITLEATRADTVRLHARPEIVPGGSRLPHAVLQHDRLAVGLDPRSGRTRWVHLGARPYLGGHADAESVLLCDGAGHVMRLGAREGTSRQEVNLGKRLIACEVQSADAPRRHHPRPPGYGPATDALVAQLGVALADPDPDLLSLQLVLLDDLAAQRGVGATSALIGLASSAKAAAPLSDAAGERLANRREGSDAMLAALDRTAPHPPLAPLARALAALEEPRAAPALARWLIRDAISDAEAREVARALERLAGPQERDALEVFFELHRCVRAPETRVDAVVAVASALLRVGDRAAIGRALERDCRDAEGASVPPDPRLRALRGGAPKR